MKKRKYKFTDKSQSRLGIVSCVISVAAMAMTAGALAAAYMQSGQAGKIVAIPVFVALCLSLMGLYYSFRGMREEDTYHLFPWLGCGMNGMILAAFAAICVLGW